jgi:hypothetical protein
MLNTNPCIYPMVIAAVIFLAILLESSRNRALEVRRPHIRNPKAA